MRTASELLGSDRDALVPLSATLVARPVRLCVFVPLYPDLPWETSVEHALACQARYWGGHANLVVPMFEGIAADDVFWHLIRQYDPDLIALHAPTVGDVEEIAPAMYEEAISRLRSSLARDGFDAARTEEYVQKARDELFWGAVDLPSDLGEALVRWTAPFHNRSDPRSILVNGSDSIAHELIDVLKSASLPSRFENLRISTTAMDQLLLTGSVGRFTRLTTHGLVERGVSVEERELQSLGEATGYMWPRDRSACPLTLPETELARRAGGALIRMPVVVVGDDPRDWLLYGGLRTLRPLVYWLPASRLDEQFFLERLLHELWWVARSAGGGNAPISVLSASSHDAAERAAAEFTTLRNRRDGPQPQIADWRDYVPRAPFWPADPRSIRTTPLLRSAGLTEELPTPTPAPFARDDLLSGGWVVDVDVRDWSAFRHPELGAKVLPGSFASSHDQRVGAGGPCYLGLAAFVQSGLSLENALSRRQLAPLAVLDALSEALSAEGWSVTLSDKGAYTRRSAQLLGGVDSLAQALRDEETRRLFDTYMSDRRSNVPGLFLTDTRRRYLSLGEAAQVLGGSAEEVVNRLYDRGALARGHALKCEQCRATSFYSLTEHQRFTCRRCRLEQRATRTSWLGDPEPAFRYELAEVIYQFLDNDGDVALLAAHDYFVSMLGARDRRPLDLGFEIDVVSPGGTKSEHDIVAVWGSDLWLGEATKNSNLGPREAGRLRRLKEVAGVLAARGLLFATTGEFSVRTRERVNSVFNSWPQPEVAFVERLPLAPSREDDVHHQ